MSGRAAAPVSGPAGGAPAGPAALPSRAMEAIKDAARARRAGQPEHAITALESGLEDLRAEPFGSPFLGRVQVALALADAYLEADQRERARRLLLDESGYAERIFHLTRLSGTPEQRRAASAGRMQVRDRATQVELLGEPAPEIEVADWVLGEGISLAELHGQVVLLEFWATWCKPCLEMFPRLRALHERHAEQGLHILALTRYGQAPGSADPEARQRERDLVRTVVADRGLAVRVGIAPDGRLQQRYGANGVPTLVLIDRAGLVRLITSGGDEAALDTAIAAALAESAPRG